MRPGIIIQHAREQSRDPGVVRCDVTGFIGVIPKARWPKGASRGDFLELQVRSYAELLQKPGRLLIDTATRRAVRSFYENGGEICHLFGVCIESEQDLMVDDPLDGVFQGLFDRLRGEEDIALLAMPVLAYLPVEYERGRVKVLCEPVMALLLEHCREMNNRFLVLDAPRDLHEGALVQWVSGFRERHHPISSYGAIYYPWLMSGDETFPPSGAMAGVYARTELEHQPLGVRWPPANQLVRGVTHPAVEVKWSETGTLADVGVNPLLTQPGRGVVVWGARTLCKDPKWMHVNARRIVSFIAEQLRRDSEWVVFEHQRPELWQIVTRMVTARLDTLWGAGLLSGDQAGSEYMVQCDEEVNPPAVRDAGHVNVKVVLRPISTAEYIVVELRLGADGASVGGF